MFFKKLFTKSDTLLNAKIFISGESSFEILDKNNQVSDQELILLALLIYGRYLRVETVE